MKVVGPMANFLRDPVVRFILEGLTWRIRVLTAGQFNRIVDARFGGGATSVLSRLVAAELLDSVSVALAYPEVVSPLYSWHPGMPAPRFNSVAWLLVRRWRTAKPRKETLWWATEGAARLCGGTTGHLQHRNQVEHDLGLANIFVRMHETSPKRADRWIGEDILRRGHELDRRLLAKVPDAAILAGGHVVEFVEFGGQYPAERIRRFHNHCRLHSIPYDLW